jgi:hypothetical protein
MTSRSSEHRGSGFLVFVAAAFLLGYVAVIAVIAVQIAARSIR